MVGSPGGQGPQPSWPGRGGQPARGLRWAASLCQAVASPAARHDDPDGFHGTLVWDTAGAGRTPAAPHPVSVLEASPSPGPGLADGQPLQLCDAAQEPASRSHPAYASDGHRVDQPCLELSGGYLASGAYRSSPHAADGRTDGSSADPRSPGPIRRKDTSTSCWQDKQKRGSSSAESGVRCLLLFSRTTTASKR